MIVLLHTQVFVATTNIGSGGTLTRTITYHPYADGISNYNKKIPSTLPLFISFLASLALENILDPSDTVTVEEGRFAVNIENGQPKIYYPTSSMEEIGRGLTCNT